MTTTTTITREVEGEDDVEIHIEARYFPKTRANNYIDSAEIILATIDGEETILTDTEEEWVIEKILNDPPHV